VNAKNIFTELKRRNVYRAAVAYGVVAWFLTQLTTQVFPFFEIPNSAVRFVVIALAAGFPIAMLLSWVYEFTPEGVVRTEDLNPVQAKSVQRATGRILDFIIIGALLLVIAMLVVGRLPFYRQTGEAISQKSIAVLPFENLSEDKANAYFADGIQDEILTRLSKIADLKVISRTSTQHYKSAPENLPEIARQLGVAHILEGRVQKSGDTVRVNVQLIKAANDSHLWADTFDRKLIDIFSVESEVAKAIAEQLRAHLSGREEQEIAAKPTDNPEAYDAYLRGLAYTLKTATTSANALGAQKHLREAVRLDPKFALSWALLSYVDSRGYLTESLQPTVALREEARQAAETALTLQPNLGEAVLAKGAYYYFCLKDYDTAVHYLSKHVSFCRIAAGFLSRSLMSHGGEASGTGARGTSSKPSGSTRATFTCSPSMRIPISVFVVFPKPCENLIRFSISHRTTWIPSRQRRVLHKPRATWRGPRRSWLLCIRTPTTPAPWKHKFTKRSWSAALHKSSLG